MVTAWEALGKQGEVTRNKDKLLFSTGTYLSIRGMCCVKCKCGNVRGKELMH